MTIESTKILGYILIGIAATPLAVYPMVLIANIMGLAGYKKPGITFMELLPARLFIFLTTVYPLTVYLSYSFFKEQYNLYYAALPYLHWVLIFIALKFWSSK